MSKRGFLAAFRNAGSGKRLGRSSKRVMVSPSTYITSPQEHVNIAEEERVPETPERLVQTSLPHLTLSDSAALRMKLDSLQKIANSNAKTIKVMTESLHQAQKLNPTRSACCQMQLLKVRFQIIYHFSCS